MSKDDHQHFEVQIFRHGRWFVEARFEQGKREDAIELAQKMNEEEKTLPVRVIMDDYVAETGRHNEIIIYRNKADTKKARRKKRVKWADMAVGPDGRVGFLHDDVDDYEDAFVAKKKTRVKVSTPMFLAIWLVILASGVGAGGASAGLLALLMKGFQISLAATAYNFFLLAMFALVFCITTSSMFGYYRARFDLNPFTKKERTPLNVQKSAMSLQMEKAAKDIDEATPEQTPQQAEAKQNIFEQGPDSSEEEEEEEFSKEADKQKIFMVNFLGSCLDTLKTAGDNTKTLNRFAMNMFMTGAVARAAENHGLSDDEQYIILCKVLEVLGATSDQAERFALEYEKYLEDPRHSQLYNSAGDLLESYQSGNLGEMLNVGPTLSAWAEYKTPQSDEEPENPHLLSIMFTDMVGSTDLTTKHGDYAAQEVLKAHDLIVRTALTNFNGKEIKHLGDGIMASFKKHDKAVQAAIEIQKRVAGNNRAGPEFPLHVRIGVNCGEPIKKNNDLFGKSVQLAARLCAFADSDTIAVSQDIRNYYLDQPPYTFVDAGAQPLKGFEHPQPIHFIDWEAPLLEYSDDDEIDVSEDDDTSEPTPASTQQESNPAPTPGDQTAPDVDVVAPCAAAPAHDPDFKEGIDIKENPQSVKPVEPSSNA